MNTSYHIDSLVLQVGVVVAHLAKEPSTGRERWKVAKAFNIPAMEPSWATLNGAFLVVSENSAVGTGSRGLLVLL